jgi:hypothetical protein
VLAPLELYHFQFVIALLLNRFSDGHRPPLQCKSELEMELLSTPGPLAVLANS